MKKNKLNIFLILGFVLMITSVFTGGVFAKGDNTLILNMKDYDKVVEELSTTENLTFKYWKIKDDISQEEFADKYTELFDISDEELDEEYVGHIESPLQLSDGKATITNIEDGTYFAKNIINNDEFIYPSAMIFQFIETGPNVFEIDAKGIEIEEDETLVRLVKEDDKANRLEGVKFELIHVLEDGEEKVKVNGLGQVSKSEDAKEVLVTDENGLIKVIGLEPGVYIFRELETLPGYRIIQSDTQFDIEAEEQVDLKVINKKDEIGDYNFLKISNNKKKTPLQGAEFKVARLLENGEETIKDSNGNDLILVSGENGQFSLRNQPYGKYKIW